MCSEKGSADGTLKAARFAFLIICISLCSRKTLWNPLL